MYWRNKWNFPIDDRRFNLPEWLDDVVSLDGCSADEWSSLCDRWMNTEYRNRYDLHIPEHWTLWERIRTRSSNSPVRERWHRYSNIYKDHRKGFQGLSRREWFWFYPKAMAPATAKPSAADLPRPREAVMEQVSRKALSVIESSNLSNTALIQCFATVDQMTNGLSIFQWEAQLLQFQLFRRQTILFRSVRYWFDI